MHGATTHTLPPPRLVAGTPDEQAFEPRGAIALRGGGRPPIRSMTFVAGEGKKTSDGFKGSESNTVSNLGSRDAALFLCPRDAATECGSDGFWWRSCG